MRGGATQVELSGANGGIEDIDIPPDAPVRVRSTPPKDDSETIALSVRESLIATLRKAGEDPALVGDLILARDVLVLLSHLLSLAKATDND